MTSTDNAEILLQREIGCWSLLGFKSKKACYAIHLEDPKNEKFLSCPFGW